MDDNFDMSDFVNFDQGFGASPTPAASQLDTSASLPPAATTFNAQGLAMQHMAGQPQQHQQQQHHQRQYNGPSHDYSGFTQQVGLPTGATQHIDAVNAFSRQVRPAAFNPQRLVAYNSGFDMDSEAGPSNDPHSYFPTGESSADDFAVDPSALAPDASKSRAWPGMHSQQAKAQEAARQAQASAHQQRREQQLGKQRQLPMDFEHTYADSSSNQPEPQVNEQITKLLNQMRHNSDASSAGDMDGTASQSGYEVPSMGRLKRDEDDLDEDERLLASEEGKKLSSKERRQLRNKVSARAFRSRRKEYITQLEGEVAAKANEANELKQTNQHLLEQNRQLTQLTKAMLAHPAFNNFMQDMSNDPSFLNSFGSAHARQQASQAPKQEQPQAHENVQVGMTMMPENNLDLSMLNLGGNHWGSGNFQQPQIFAVHSLPEAPLIESLLPPSIDPKSSSDVTAATDLPAKAILPRVEARLPVAEAKPSYPVAPVAVSDADDPSFALYVDTPANTTTKPTPTLTLADAARQLECSLSGKPSSQITLKVKQRPVDEATAIRDIDCMFASLEPAASRIAAMAFLLS